MLTLDPASLIMCSPADAQRYDAQRPPKRHRPAGPSLPLLRTPVTPLPTPTFDESQRPVAEDSVPILPPALDLLDGTPHTLKTEAGTMVLGPDGIARVRVRKGHWAKRSDVTAFLEWINALCPTGAPLLIDKRRPYALDFSAQQAITELLRVPAAAILIPTLDKLPLAEYARETYMRHVTTRIFRSETHALRWLGTYVGDGPFLPAHDLIQLPMPLDFSN